MLLDDVAIEDGPNFVNTESAEDHSDYAEPQEPKYKRQRTNQVTKSSTRVRGKHGRLEGLMNMPIDIFTEIALYLMPEDIIVLARSNKFFRNLLMNRSAVHIWHGVMRNVPQLPPCPPNLYEPQYLALIYSRNCSICGSHVTRRMDELLLVRLCGPCRDERLSLTNGLPKEVQGWVPFSTTTVPSNRRRGQEVYSLRSEADEVIAQLQKLENSKDQSALVAWAREREEAVAARRLQSTVLKAFLDNLESEGHITKDNLKSQRRIEIQRRLVELGWDDADFGYAGGPEWNRLVEQPKPLTERIWTNIRPKLIPLLEASRTLRLAHEKMQRKYARKSKLVQLLADIKLADPVLIDAHITDLVPHPSLGPAAPTVQVLHRRLFPMIHDLLEYPIMKSLNETDVSASEMETRFKEHREEIDTHISEWRRQTEGYMAELLRKGRTLDELEETAPTPTLPVGESESNPLDNVSDDLKILLRADSLFESLRGPHRAPLTYYSLASSEDSSFYNLSRQHSLDLTGFKRHVEAQYFARALLGGIGKADASFLELKNVGRGFMCGRCYSGSLYSWEEMVAHYVEEKRDWEELQVRMPAAEKLGITFKDVHALDTDSDKPFVKLVHLDQHIDLIKQSGPAVFECRLCMKVGGLQDLRIWKDSVIEHVIEVHGVAHPRAIEHYYKPTDSFSGFDMPDDEDE